MTILQLKYMIAIASSSSLREAANKLYVSQPALSSMVHELEEELDIQIFDRTNKGIRPTEDGLEFLAYAKQAVSQYGLLEERYLEKSRGKKHFSVSMQHYVFAVHAFVNTVKRFDYSSYTYSVYETKTDEVLNNVRDMRSEVGVISFSRSNARVMQKLFRDYGLRFVSLMVRGTYAYVWKDHPLSGRGELSIKELEAYPCVSFEQSDESDFYLPEEALGNYDFDRVVKSNDRATTAEIMAALNGYSIGTGIMADSLALGDGFVSIKLKEEDPLTIGFLTRQSQGLSEIGKAYVEELLKYKE